MLLQLATAATMAHAVVRKVNPMLLSVSQAKLVAPQCANKKMSPKNE
jgi:hypothetical protein